MASKLYDVDASRARVAQVQKHIIAQRAYILTLPPDGRGSAQKNLEALEDMLEIAKKTHLLITEVVLARSDIERETSGRASPLQSLPV